MSKIKKLDDKLMNMIAAGEVVERPAGIVKELIENSIDADASKIEVNVINGGIDLINVIDNGRGMSKEDAVLAFERHATSKLHREQDLWSIGTLGFRGEAIPSIASVSKTQLITHDGSEGTIVQVDYGDMKKADVIGANRGTNIKISGLFYQTPARLKYLKSIPYEMAIITSNIEKFALSHPDIAFILKNDGKETFATSGSGHLLEVMFEIYGGDVARSAIEFHNKDADFRIEGLLALPSNTRANRNHILLFINDRMVRDYQMTNAVIKGYEKYIPSDRFPIAVLKVYTDYKLVDVNVHPSKWQVRISKENQLRDLIIRTLEAELGNHMQAPRVRSVISHNKPEQTSISFRSNPQKLPEFNRKIETDVHTESVQKDIESSGPLHYPSGVIKEDNSNLYQAKENEVEPVNCDQSVESSFESEHDQELEVDTYDNNFPQMTLIGQMHGKYILAEDESGLYIIDQHAAEERVNFEKISEKLLSKQQESTALLVPEMVELDKSSVTLLERYTSVLSNLGVVIEMFGDSSVVIREVPLWLKDNDLNQFVHDLLDYLQKHGNVTEADLRKDVLATMACHSSIRFNRVLTKDEMQKVIDNLSEAKQPFHCPHGRPTFIKIEENQLFKEFLR